LEIELLQDRQFPPERYSPRAQDKQVVEEEQVGQVHGRQEDVEDER
jgi:hypothetical protein